MRLSHRRLHRFISVNILNAVSSKEDEMTSTPISAVVNSMKILAVCGGFILKKWGRARNIYILFAAAMWHWIRFCAVLV
jgi:hypothetical protein